MNRSQLINFVIDPVLYDMDKWSQPAEDLLVMIAGHESAKGEFIHQNSGPATGIFQMEKLTHDGTISYLEKRRPELLDKLFNWTPRVNFEMMAGNMHYATFMARARLLMIPEPIPEEPAFMAQYAKKYWNTDQGKATVDDYLIAFDTWGRVPKNNRPVGPHGAPG